VKCQARWSRSVGNRADTIGLSLREGGIGIVLLSDSEALYGSRMFTRSIHYTLTRIVGLARRVILAVDVHKGTLEKNDRHTMRIATSAGL
jgi:hypothetical protein